MQKESKLKKYVFLGLGPKFTGIMRKKTQTEQKRILKTLTGLLENNPPTTMSSHNFLNYLQASSQFMNGMSMENDSRHSHIDHLPHAERTTDTKYLTIPRSLIFLMADISA